MALRVVMVIKRMEEKPPRVDWITGCGGWGKEYLPVLIIIVTDIVHQVMKFPAGATKPSLGEETFNSFLFKNIIACWSFLVIFHQQFHHNLK